MPTRLTRAAVAILAGFSLLAVAAPAEAAGPHGRSRSSHSSSHRSSHRSDHHASRSHVNRSYGNRSYRHSTYPRYRSYHRSYNPLRSYGSHRSHQYYRSRSYCPPSYSISFGTDRCSSGSSIYWYGGRYDCRVYPYPKFRYDPRCRPYSSGVYLSYETDVYVAADSPRSLTCEAPVVRVIDATDAGPTEIGFKLLAAGEYPRALSFFADASSRDLDEPMSKLGYSLASAAQGNDDRALWAMQRAVEAGADELPSWPACRELADLVETLKDRYQAKADRYVHTPDREALFMVAALNHVTGDRQGAQAALVRAYPGGRDFYTPATRALAEAVGGGSQIANSK